MRDTKVNSTSHLLEEGKSSTNLSGWGKDGAQVGLTLCDLILQMTLLSSATGFFHKEL